MGEKFRIAYDDNVLDIVDKISAALRPHGLEVVFDEEEHDGFELCEVKVRSVKGDGDG